MKQLYELGVKRVTFVVQAENRRDVLARVVLLFHRLNVEIDALYMVRRHSSETMRVSVTAQADRERSQRIQANLYKVVSVTSVKIERGGKEVLRESPEKEFKAESHS